MFMKWAALQKTETETWGQCEVFTIPDKSHLIVLTALTHEVGVGQ